MDTEKAVFGLPAAFGSASRRVRPQAFSLGRRLLRTDPLF